MLSVVETPSKKFVELTVDGAIEKAEFHHAIEQLEAAIERDGKIRVLENIVNFRSFPPSCLWADMRFGFQHRKDVTHAAVVADKRWIKTLTQLADPLTKMQIRYFDAEDIDAAREWLATAD